MANQSDNQYTLVFNGEGSAFKNHIEILSKILHKEDKSYDAATYPVYSPRKKAEPMEGLDGHRYRIWMPGHKNRAEITNTCINNGEVFSDTAEPLSEEEKNVLRFTFYRERNGNPFRFYGVYKFVERRTNENYYERISESVTIEPYGFSVKNRKTPRIIVEYQLTKKDTIPQLDENDLVFIKNVEEETEKVGLIGKEKEAYVKVRVNQDEFRKQLIKTQKRCVLCGMNRKSLLIASHIKPWNVSDENEKLSIDNGLLLCPNHDKLFDSGLISFEDTGKIIICDDMTKEECKLLNIGVVQRLKLTNEKGEFYMSPRMQTFMKYHRENVFVDANLL